MEVGGAKTQLGRDEFLKLLVTQLRTQDPLDPVSNEDMLAQLAQFSALEGVEKLNASFADMLKLNQITQGANLIGWNVTYQPPGSNGIATGAVEGFRVENGALQLLIDGVSVPLDNVRQIS